MAKKAGGKAAWQARSDEIKEEYLKNAKGGKKGKGKGKSGGRWGGKGKGKGIN